MTNLSPTLARICEKVVPSFRVFGTVPSRKWYFGTSRKRRICVVCGLFSNRVDIVDTCRRFFAVFLRKNGEKIHVKEKRKRVKKRDYL